MKAEEKRELVKTAGQKALCALFLDTLAAQNPAWIKKDETLLAGALLNAAPETLTLRFYPTMACEVLLLIKRSGLPNTSAASFAQAEADSSQCLAHLKLPPEAQNGTRLIDKARSNPFVEVRKFFQSPALLGLWNIPMAMAVETVQAAEQAEMQRLCVPPALPRAWVLRR